ncbi:uncharacterized protein FTOL_03688 [Fusarium torulosum]|uniref:Uncharacterized protein n=1 Tax=Fusarium torulosum TaxID=33205 RepID=A0AAE8M597_9HYPO|nr:uncharacterized protein FTOL_03688 [Fusarium torulosum]
MDPYRRFYEPNYIASTQHHPPPANPPQASQTSQSSLSPPILTPASNEVTGYPPPLDMDRIIPDGSIIPGSHCHTGTTNSRQYRSTSVANPGLNGLASIASTYSPPSTYRLESELGETASPPPPYDNPFYRQPAHDYRPTSAHRSTLPRLRPETSGPFELRIPYAPEGHIPSHAPEVSRGPPRYYQVRRTHRLHTHNAPSPDTRSYEYPGYEASKASATPSERNRVQSWLSNISPGSPQEPASQARTHRPQSRYNPSSTHTANYCLNCKSAMRSFSLRCNDCWDRHIDRVNGLDSSWEPAYCIRCNDDIGEAYILCERHQQDPGFLTQDRKRTLEREGICCYCWIEAAQWGSDRCSTCRNRSRQWIVDGAEAGLQREVCIRCERRTTSQLDGICSRCKDYERRRSEHRH